MQWADLENPRKSANPFGGPTVTWRPQTTWAYPYNGQFKHLGPKIMLAFTSLKHQITDLFIGGHMLTGPPHKMENSDNAINHICKTPENWADEDLNRRMGPTAIYQVCMS